MRWDQLRDGDVLLSKEKEEVLLLLSSRDGRETWLNLADAESGTWTTKMTTEPDRIIAFFTVLRGE